jgi:5-methylcytosine-specific restriction endonuclease McrA
MALILARDGECCVWCSTPLALGDRLLTFEHVVPRLKGGPSWAENEVPACRACNRARGHLAPSLFLEQARDPRREVIERALLSLRDAIAERGGQRRARPYLERELRRLGLLERP